jgi:hypothetical protein
VAPADRVIADRLPEATLPTQIAIVRSFVGAVVERPELFEATVGAYATATDADRQVVAQGAVRALAAVASVDAELVPSREQVLTRAEELSALAKADPRPNTGRETRAAARALTRAFEGDRAVRTDGP